MTFGHNSWRCILSNGKNFPTFKCTHCNKTGHTKSRCFEIMGYPDWWDHNRDQRKKDSKKTSTVAIAEIKTEANVDEKASALVATTDYDGKFLNTSTPVINSAWCGPSPDPRRLA